MLAQLGCKVDRIGNGHGSIYLPKPILSIYLSKQIFTDYLSYVVFCIYRLDPINIHSQTLLVLDQDIRFLIPDCATAKGCRTPDFIIATPITGAHANSTREQGHCLRTACKELSQTSTGRRHGNRFSRRGGVPRRLSGSCFQARRTRPFFTMSAIEGNASSATFGKVGSAESMRVCHQSLAFGLPTTMRPTIPACS